MRVRQKWGSFQKLVEVKKMSLFAHIRVFCDEVVISSLELCLAQDSVEVTDVFFLDFGAEEEILYQGYAGFGVHVEGKLEALWFCEDCASWRP